ncbi:MAG: ice-binding family protein [Candidatus Dormibacteria bacterium]
MSRVTLRRPRAGLLLVLCAAVIAVVWPAAASAATQPRLGTAANFAALAGSTITNTGSTVLTGDLGLDPGTSVTGFPPGQVTGTQHIADAVAQQAKRDLVTAYNDAATAPSTADLSGQDLGGKNLTPGVYTYSSSAQLTGSLTLSGDGVFIFQVSTTLTTATNSVVSLVNGAQACAVYWQVGTSATLGTGTQFEGTLMAQTSITMVTNAAILTGRALASNGALTLDTNRVTRPTGGCTVSGAATPGPSATVGPTPSASPSPGSSPSPSPSPTPSPAGPAPTPPTASSPSSPGGPTTSPTPAISLAQTGGPRSQPAFPWRLLAISSAFLALLYGLRRLTF